MFDGAVPNRVTGEPITAREAVQNGVWFLRRIPGAMAKLSAGTLRIECEDNCALAQVFGSYGEALEILDLPADLKPSDLGFDASPHFSLADLNVAWQAELARA
jgi:hypothetical protein